MSAKPKIHKVHENPMAPKGVAILCEWSRLLTQTPHSHDWKEVSCKLCLQKKARLKEH